jgi:hypothetical protein
MRMQVYELLGGNLKNVPDALKDAKQLADAFEQRYNDGIADPVLYKMIPHLTPTFHKCAAAILVSPTLVCLSGANPESLELIPKTLPASCVGCGKEWKQSIPTKGAEFFILSAHDTIRSADLGPVSYPTEPIGFWACTGHAAIVTTLHKCIHFMTHFKRDLGRLLPDHIRTSPQTSWESLTGPVYSKKPLSKWPTTPLKDNAFPLVSCFATHKKTLKALEGYIEALSKGAGGGGSSVAEIE